MRKGARGFAAALGGTKRWVAENDLALFQSVAHLTERVAEMHDAFVVALHAVQQAVHKGQAAGVGNELDADIACRSLSLPIPGRKVVEIVGLF